MRRYRINRVDSLNWAIEELKTVQESKNPNKQSNRVGEKQWVPIAYYGNNLKMACLDALKYAPEGTTGAKEILAAIKEAEASILESVKSLDLSKFSSYEEYEKIYKEPKVKEEPVKRRMRRK